MGSYHLYEHENSSFQSRTTKINSDASVNMLEVFPHLGLLEFGIAFQAQKIKKEMGVLE